MREFKTATLPEPALNEKMGLLRLRLAMTKIGL